MKKIIFLLMLSLMTIKSNAQTLSLFHKPDQVFAMNDVKSIKIDIGHTESMLGKKSERTIDLKLPGGPKYTDPNTNKNGGLALILGGIGFTTASILESGDFKIYQGETARQIMLGTGIVLTITGVIVIGK